MTERPIKLPHALVLIYGLVVATWLLTLVLPSGAFQRVEKTFEGKARMVTVPGTYARTPKHFLGPQWLLLGPVKGFEDGAPIIAFLMIVVGAFNVVQKTGAIEAGIARLADRVERSPMLRRLAVPLLMGVFSLGGGVFGMSEETIPFVVVFIPLARSLGYDSLVGVAIPFLGAAAGFAAAFFNPFTVGVAQGFCGLPVYSGLSYRVLLWVLGTGVVSAYVLLYAERVRAHPESSAVYAIDQARRDGGPAVEIPWDRTRKCVLGLLAAGMGVLVFGILVEQWYIEEIAALFMALGLLCGVVARGPF